MAHTNYNEALFEEEARVAGVYPIGMIGDPESPPEWLTELYDAADAPEHPLFAALPQLRHDADDVAEWADALVMFPPASGILVKYEVCIRRYCKPPSTAWYSGWGLYSSGYLAVEDFEEIGPAVLAAVRARHEVSKAKAGAE